VHGAAGSVVAFKTGSGAGLAIGAAGAAILMAGAGVVTSTGEVMFGG
jgi:hypothetical protein